MKPLPLEIKGHQRGGIVIVFDDQYGLHGDGSQFRSIWWIFANSVGDVFYA
jgi:hypothetical protein